MINRKNNVLFVKPIALTLFLLAAMLISSHCFAGQVTFTVDPASTCIAAGLCTASSSAATSAPVATVPVIAYTYPQTFALTYCTNQSQAGYRYVRNPTGYLDPYYSYPINCGSVASSLAGCQAAAGSTTYQLNSSSTPTLSSSSCAYVPAGLTTQQSNTILACGKSTSTAGANVGDWAFRKSSGCVVAASATNLATCQSALTAAGGFTGGCVQIPQQ